ncbi:MAG: hypothetical protein KC766_22055 [Myxococcales bacterium]|nr:hypothetical protein [Myxococcales bacterium]
MLVRSLFLASVCCVVFFAACGGEEFSGGGGSAGAGGVSGAGGSGAGGSGASAGSNPGGNAGAGGASGAAGRPTGGAGGALDAGAAGTNQGGGPIDGGMDGSNVDGCALERWYPDQDKDGYGRSSGVVESCERPEGEYLETGGDCNDDNPDVFPGQMKFFAEPYQTGSGSDSFDYDCSQKEEGDSSQYGAAPSNCSVLMIGGCSGQGFVGTGRTGPTLNPLCGSKTLRTCTWQTVSCNAIESDVSAKRCR